MEGKSGGVFELRHPSTGDIEADSDARAKIISDRKFQIQRNR
jgi:hypothetical protein